MDFTQKTCREFTEVLAGSDPVPGGGGAAALVGAIGTALGSMVGSLTVGKKRYADVEEEIRALMQCFDHPDYVASCGFDCHPESSEEMMECMCRFLPGDFAGNIKNMQQMLKMMQVMQAMNDSGSQGPPPNNNCGNPCDFPPQPGCGAPPPPPDYAPRQDIGRNPDHNCNNRSGRHKDLYSSVMDILNSQ